jgi:hypothetical protein
MEYIFNFCNLHRLKFRAGHFSNALPNAKLWTFDRNALHKEKSLRCLWQLPVFFSIAIAVERSGFTCKFIGQ